MPPGCTRATSARSTTSASACRSSTRTRCAASATSAAIRTAGCCASTRRELTGVGSTSGTTGDPTLVPEQWGGGGLTLAVDHHPRSLGLGRAAGRLRDARAVHVPRPDLRAVPALARHDADPLRLRPGRDGAVLRAVARVPADRGLQLRLGAHQRGEGRVRPARLRPARRVLVVQGRDVRGRAAVAARPRARRELGRRAVRARQRRRRHRLVRVRRARRPAHLGGHRARRGRRRRRATGAASSSRPRSTTTSRR